MGSGPPRRLHPRRLPMHRLPARPGAWKLTMSPPLRAGADPYDLDGILTYCRACHISRHREDDMVPGRPAWLEFVAEMAGE